METKGSKGYESKDIGQALKDLPEYGAKSKICGRHRVAPTAYSAHRVILRRFLQDPLE